METVKKHKGKIVKVIRKLKKNQTAFQERLNDKILKMNNLKIRRESLTNVYKLTTKFISANTNLLLKRIPSAKKYQRNLDILDKLEENVVNTFNKNYDSDDDEGEDFGDKDLDYYLGARKSEACWRDFEREEQMRKDYLLNHCDITQEDYNKFYKRISRKPCLIVTPKLKQVPFRIYKKKRSSEQKEDIFSWSEKAGSNIIKMFLPYRRSSESTSDSYSECDSLCNNIETDLKSKKNDDTILQKRRYSLPESMKLFTDLSISHHDMTCHKVIKTYSIYFCLNIFNF